VLVFAAFAPALSGEFLQWDDEDNIALNHDFRGLDAAHLEWMFTTDRMGPYQPLAWVSLGIDHALYGLSGPEVYREAPDYHRTSVAIHALAAIACFFLAKRLLSSAFAAFVAAAFFAIHPLRVESVAWVTERRDVLCGLFYVLAAWAWVAYAQAKPDVRDPPSRLRNLALASIVAGALAWFAIDLSDPRALALRDGGPWMLLASAVLLGVATWSRASRGYTLALLAFLAALLSKGLALVLPLVLLVADVWPLRRAKDLRTFAACAVEKLPMLVLSVLFARIAFWGQRWIPGSWSRGRTTRSASASCRRSTASRSTSGDAGPAPALADLRASVRPAHHGPAVPRAGRPRPRRRGNPRRETASRPGARRGGSRLRDRGRAGARAQPGRPAARRGSLQLPRLPAVRAARRRGGRAPSLAIEDRGLRRGDPRARRADLRLLLDLEDLGLALGTRARGRARLVPAGLESRHARVRQAEATTDKAKRDALLEEAVQLFEEARAHGDPPLASSGLALVRQRQWQLDPRHPKELAEASLEHARRALELAQARHVEEPKYHLNLGVALGNAGHPNEALDELRKFVAEVPDSFLGHQSIGVLLLQIPDHAGAARELERAVGSSRPAVDAWGNLGIAKQELGQREEAIRCFERVLVLHPGHPVARDRLFKLKSRMTVDVVPQDAPK
jgi:tetratricopeptide (TPR) repeat protein